MKGETFWLTGVAAVAALLGAGAYLGITNGDRPAPTTARPALGTAQNPAPLVAGKHPQAPAGANTVRAFGFAPAAADADDIAEVRFVDGDGRRMTLADFQGRNVLLNVWATWCGPCREEMPTLDRLQARLGSADFEVVALSIDLGGLEVVRDFYQELDLKALRIYVDPSGSAAVNLNVLGLPSTLLLDRQGHELGRYIGPAEWDSEPVIRAIQDRLNVTTTPR